MPSYDFECNKCKIRFELSLTIADREAGKAKCPKCGNKDVTQVFSKLTMVDDMATEEAPEMPPGPPPGMGGMPMGMPGMCGPGGCGFM